jgi:hypothetical protein
MPKVASAQTFIDSRRFTRSACVRGIRNEVPADPPLSA